MEPIAIVGLSFRLPGGAESSPKLWELMEKGQNVMQAWPDSRASINAFYDADSNQNNILRSKGAHFLDQDPSVFDAPFFSIPSKEASSMDPQQRMLMETAYHALENAGMPLDRIAGSATGVFAGSMTEDYIKMVSKDPDEAPMNVATGASMSLLANRLSWFFDLKGPSLQVNTACSSSMTALDLASFFWYQASLTKLKALVTGSNLILSPETSAHLTNMNFLSPDSLSFSFDHRANGYGRGEGVVVLILKCLSDAVKNGDMIRAVIRGATSNQNGHTPGITQPSLASQEELIRAIYKSCNLGLESTGYIEAHGTGTQLGDSTEARAIGKVFGRSRSPDDPIYIGSIKANFGHLEGASSLAAIVKAVMILEKGIIPPNALFERWNPKINAKQWRIKVPTSCTPWPSDGLRRISVNSFGFGGSNSHVILDDAYHALREVGMTANHCTTIYRTDPNRDGSLRPISNGTLSNGESKAVHENNGVVDPSAVTQLTEKPISNGIATSPRYRLLVWSAKDQSGLSRTHQQYNQLFSAHVSGISHEYLDQIAYTLAMRRSVMAWRSFAVVSAEDAMVADLLSSSQPLMRSSRDVSLAFIFTGQGAQYSKMGLSLLKYPVFRASLERSSAVFHELGADWALLEAIQQESSKINEPRLSQPLCTALQLALVDLLKSFNIRPTAVVGHSSGEIAAAYTIGALSFTSACKVAYHRGRLAGTTTRPGSMISVNLTESGVQYYLDKIIALSLGDVHIACINSPSNLTLSGDVAAIDALQSILEENDVFARKLNTGVAYHSPAMQEIASTYQNCLDSTMDQQDDNDDGTNSNIIMISTVTGDKVSRATLSDSRYWVDNLVSPVRFADVLQYLQVAAPRADHLKPVSMYLEIGPHGALRKPITDTLNATAATPGSHVDYLVTLSRFDISEKPFLATVGHLFARGYPVNVAAANQHQNESHSPFLVDLPGYPFDHSQNYWLESRLSREWRLREGALTPSSLLGKRAVGWNPLRPRWRKVLSEKDTPWISHHVVGDVPFFPAAGMLIMALEAVKQVAADQAHVLGSAISGFLIKEAVFSSPIIVRPEVRTEVEINLVPLHQVYEKASPRSEVTILALVDGYWNECFKATIVSEHEPHHAAPTEIDGGREERAVVQDLRRAYEDLVVIPESLHPVKKQEFYGWQDKQGLKYGEAFSLVQDIFWDGEDQAIAEVDSSVLLGETSDDLIHPTVLDACFQVCSVAPSSGMLQTLPTCLPHKVKDAWIAASGWTSDQSSHDSQLRVWTRSKLKSELLGVESSLTILNNDNRPLCHFGNFEMAAVAVGNLNTGKEAASNIFTSMTWKPQLSALTPYQLKEYCSRSYKHGEDSLAEHAWESPATSSQYAARLESVLRKVLTLNLPQLLRETDLPTIPEHMSRYLSWAKGEALLETMTLADNDSSQELLAAELEALQNEKASWKFTLQVAQNLGSIVRGVVDPHEIFLSEPTSPDQDFWRELSGPAATPELARFLALSAHEKPGQRILYYGVGTDGAADRVVSMLQKIETSTGCLAYSDYVYTDKSATFLDHARRRLSGGSSADSRVTFMPLDMEQDMPNQGFANGSYDIIFLSRCGIQRTGIQDMALALRNLARTLRHGGYLVIIDNSMRDRKLDFALCFGLGVLPDWWPTASKQQNSEHTSHIKPLNDPDFDKTLRENGFAASSVLIEGSTEHRYGLMVAAVAQSEVPQETQAPLADGRNFVIIVGDDDQENHPGDVVASLVKKFALPEARVLSISQIISNSEALVGMHLVFLADPYGTMLAHMSESAFVGIQLLIGKSKSLLWVTLRKMDDQDHPPYSALKDGFLRTLRTEFSNKRIVSLSVEDACPAEVTADHIAQILLDGPAVGAAVDAAEVEYIVRNGFLHTGRLVQEKDLDDRLVGVPERTRTEPWFGGGEPLKLEIGSPGSLESLRFVEDHTAHAEPLAPNEVEIEAKAWGLNFREVFIALGRLPAELSDGLGSDCAGVVTRVGVKCNSDRIRPGDRVFMFAVGCMRKFPRAEEFAVVHIPDSLNFAEACAVIAPAVTAWHSLSAVARLSAGEKILIHAASGATGQLAVQISRHLGAEVFATVGYEFKKRLLLDSYGHDGTIAEDHILYSRDLSFSKGIKRLTHGYGVDVVLNSLVGEGLRESWECIAPYGRFIEIGKADIQGNASLPMAQFARNVSFSAVDLRHLMQTRPDIGHKLLCDVVGLIKDGKIEPPKPVHTYKLSAVEEAFRYFQSGKNTGRVIIEVDRSEVVEKHLVAACKTWTFDAQAAYLIAGGLGGIGRSILKWMARQGAKHLIVPSRSGTAMNQDAARVVEELGRQGVTVVTPKCDVAVAEELSLVISQCKRPILGCINAAMALNDSAFENMTHSQWEGTVKSKVQTSWNLHTLLPKDLDFFILLSSVSGLIGNGGQANYAAGCTFQDALARFRHHHGQKALSIDLGVVSGIGVVAETQGLHQKLTKGLRDLPHVSEDEILSTLAMYCDPAGPPRSSSHIAMGVADPAGFLASDLEAPEFMQIPLFNNLRAKAEREKSSGNTTQKVNYAALIRQAETPSAVASIILEALSQKLAHALGIKSEDIDAHQPLHAFGVDSLVAIELRSWISKEFSADVSVFDLAAGRSLTAVCDLIASKIR